MKAIRVTSILQLQPEGRQADGFLPPALPGAELELRDQWLANGYDSSDAPTVFISTSKTRRQLLAIESESWNWDDDEIEWAGGTPASPSALRELPDGPVTAHFITRGMTVLTDRFPAGVVRVSDSDDSNTAALLWIEGEEESDFRIRPAGIATI